MMGINDWIQRKISRELLQKSISDETYVLFKNILQREVGYHQQNQIQYQHLNRIDCVSWKAFSVFFLGKTLKFSWRDYRTKRMFISAFTHEMRSILPLLRYSWRRKKKEGGEEEEKEEEEKERNVTYVILTLFNLKLHFASFTWLVTLKSSLLD